MNRRDREVGGKGGREESVAATADSELEPREEVWRNIFNVTEKARQEENSGRTEMNILAKPPHLKWCGSNWQLDRLPSINSNK